MPEVRRVDASVFEPVYDTLLRSLNPRVSREAWHRIFTYGWQRSEDYIGYALFDDRETIVGFTGFLFSEPMISGERYRICNLTTWVVQDSYRSMAVALVLPVLKSREYTLTNMTSEPQFVRLFRQFGFDLLETHATMVLPPVPWVPRRFRPPIEFTSDPAAIEGALQDVELQVFRDHRQYARHLLAADDTECCHLIYARTRYRRVRTARLYYFSNEQFFVRHMQAIQRELLRREGTVLIEFDQRLVRAPVGRSFSRRLLVPRLFRSDVLPREAIPNTYSELILLGF